MLGIIGGAAILTAAPLSLQWSQKHVALSLDSAEAQVGGRQLRRALQVSAEGFSEGRIAAQFTQPQRLDRVDTAITAIARRSPAATYLTEQATSHLAATTAAATP